MVQTSIKYFDIDGIWLNMPRESDANSRCERNNLREMLLFPQFHKICRFLLVGFKDNHWILLGFIGRSLFGYTFMCSLRDASPCTYSTCLLFSCKQDCGFCWLICVPCNRVICSTSANRWQCLGGLPVWPVRFFIPTFSVCISTSLNWSLQWTILSIAIYSTVRSTENQSV